MTRKSEIRTKNQATQFIATKLIAGMDDLEAFAREAGADISRMTTAEVTRLEWAANQIRARLHRMAKVTSEDSGDSGDSGE